MTQAPWNWAIFRSKVRSTDSPAEPGVGRGRVWTLLGKSMLKPHDLKLGGTNGLFTVVLGGDLKPGDKVVTDSKMPGVQ